MNANTPSTHVIEGAVTVTGGTVTEKRLSVVQTATAEATLYAAANAKGKVRAAAIARLSTGALTGIVNAAAKGTYRPVAEWIAMRTGKPFTVASRAVFEALPDLMENAVTEARAGKNGGLKADGTPGARLATALELKAFCVDVVGAVSAMHAERKKQAAVAAIEAPEAESAGA